MTRGREMADYRKMYTVLCCAILGFDENVEIKNHNFRQVDALPYAKEGTLSELLDELFGE